ncbi:hypothetical protein DAPPUDRAFT_241250 [Daphnia pulex]|uniref:Uncharacterized protein n=1 Tax=Daphnia pulex TaxID=6669 RepID=E9GDT3_DAPPU|nr:hypothetical protein DAPPUDRAFT_241250 [Daphnia pulex]|eukprot:EFX82138.1 hypothetical protein DAPPUDRAFT_241250 [Daphnia pulex]
MAYNSFGNCSGSKAHSLANSGYRTATLPPYYTTAPYATTGYFTTKAPEYHAAAYDAYELHHQRACRLHLGFQYAGCQTGEPPPYYTTYATTNYYTIKAPEYYTTTCAAPSCTTKLPETGVLHDYVSCPVLRDRGSQYYSAPSSTMTTEEVKYCYPTAAPSYYIDLNDYTDAIANYAKTYATPRYCTTEVEYYTTTNAAPVYYNDEPQYYSSLSYYRTETSDYYTT